jgi:PEP-CTERM motif-containing protein
MKKLSYLFVLFALIILSASTTKGDVVDPLIGGGGSGTCSGSAVVDLMSATQMVTITSGELNMGCIVDFLNDTGAPLTSLVVTVDTPFSGPLGCFILPGTSPFGVASPSIPIITDSCTFSGGGGVPNGTLFGLEFGGTVHPFCLNDPTTGVCQNLTSLDVTLHPTPEPASIALIGTGLAALVARRKKLGSRSPLSNCVC